LSPGRLLELAATLFGRAPTAVQVTVSVGRTEVETTLSPEVARAVPAVVETVFGAIGRATTIEPSERRRNHGQLGQ
jgi:hypothetical protein